MHGSINYQPSIVFNTQSIIIMTKIADSEINEKELIIRHAQLKDSEEIRYLISEMEEKELPADTFGQIYRTQLHNDKFLCLVGEMAGKVVACINLRMEWQLHHAARICEIMEFAVQSDCRSQGIGKRLFDRACNEAKAEGCVQIEVACNQLRVRTHHFYERMGMHNFHYKFSLDFSTDAGIENRLGR